ncbi:hypothetical protein M422DRAFT_263818 [Sphaerobolus stellatus SS14]|uniref:Uncharacterized protein n=1 Tax=Sphaerobolus stellatus (strain SS14) TaxID=990650 RepID=A0A0C9UXX9_SPHS4|nr:hypothetical protein M422DRAFT_263818 [Sphaerobolus stellatus SS14]
MTYKHVFGEFNEWEVVIWDPYLNSCVPISHVYCNRESRQAYGMVWDGWFEAIKMVTGAELKIKAIHGEGSHTIFMVDGAAAQVQGLGDNLLRRNNPAISKIDTLIAEEIVQHLIRTCNVHCNRKLDSLRAVMSPEDFEYISRFRYIYYPEEMKKFQQWCLDHHEQKVQDWMRNKLAHPWYIPSLCRHFSKIPKDDWDLSPNDTNLNEQSHPASNMATGIGLNLLPAILSIYEHDLQIATDRETAYKSHILKNPRNALVHRFHSNARRSSNHAKRADESHEKREALRQLEAELALAKQQQRESADKVKALQAEKKQQSGGKKWNLRTSGRGIRTPSIASSSSANKENDPFLQPPTAFTSHSMSTTCHIELEPALEPPFHSQLQPSSGWQPYAELSGTHLQQQQHRVNVPSHGYPAFPASTCPPAIHFNAAASRSGGPIPCQYNEGRDW